MSNATVSTGPGLAGERPSGRRRPLRGVRVRLFTGYGLLLLMMLVGLAAAFSSANVLQSDLTHTVNTVDVLSSANTRVAGLLAGQHAGLNGYLLTGKTEYQADFDMAGRAIPAVENGKKEWCQPRSNLNSLLGLSLFHS